MGRWLNRAKKHLPLDRFSCNMSILVNYVLFVTVFTKSRAGGTAAQATMFREGICTG